MTGADFGGLNADNVCYCVGPTVFMRLVPGLSALSSVVFRVEGGQETGWPATQVVGWLVGLLVGWLV